MTKTSGYSFIELVISLTIFSILMSSGINLFSNIKLSDNIKSTKEKLSIIEKSLQNFVLVNGFLPCPALMKETKNDPSYGDSSNMYDEILHECTGENDRILENQTGIIPVRQLKLDDKFAYDGWGRKFAYRIANGFGNKNDFEKKGLNNFTGDIKIIDLQGNELTNISGNYPKNFGAAYVIVSYGLNGEGAWNDNLSKFNLKPKSDLIEAINSDHSNKIYVYGETNSDDIILYKRKDELIDLSYAKSPLNIPDKTCSNAKLISEKGINNINITQINDNNSAILGPINTQILFSANAINNLCNNQNEINCDFRPFQVGNNLILWLRGDLPYGENGNLVNGEALYSINNGYTNYIKSFSSDTINITNTNIKPVYIENTPFANSKSAIFIEQNSDFIINVAATNTIGPAFTIFIVATYYNNSAISSFRPNIAFAPGDERGVLIYSDHLESFNKQNNFGIKPTNLKDGDIILITVKIENLDNDNNYYSKFKLRNSGGFLYESFWPGSFTKIYTLDDISFIISPAPLGHERYRGYFGELLLYNGQLTESEILSVENYLLRKWFSGECE